jgi:hypothetical protein
MFSYSNTVNTLSTVDTVPKTSLKVRHWQVVKQINTSSYKIIPFYFQHVKETKIIILEILLNTKDISSIMLSTQDTTYPQSVLDRQHLPWDSS